MMCDAIVCVVGAARRDTGDEDEPAGTTRVRIIRQRARAIGNYYGQSIHSKDQSVDTNVTGIHAPANGQVTAKSWLGERWCRKMSGRVWRPAILNAASPRG